MSDHAATVSESLDAAEFTGTPACRCKPAFSWVGWLPLVLAVLGSTMLLAGSKLPLWEMHMEAPQYRDEEALEVAVFPGRFEGDLAELAVLNQYIGVHVPETLPQFKWLPGALLASAIAGLLAGLLPGTARRVALMVAACGLAAALAVAVLQAKNQMHDIGHKRDQKTVLTGVRDFTPPLLGSTRIAQFDVSSRLASGAWLTGGALLMFIGGAWVSRGKDQLS